jgi:hypothetical protein
MRLALSLSQQYVETHIDASTGTRAVCRTVPKLFADCLLTSTTQGYLPLVSSVVQGVIVGSETQIRGDMSMAALQAYITQARNMLNAAGLTSMKTMIVDADYAYITNTQLFNMQCVPGLGPSGAALDHAGRPACMHMHVVCAPDASWFASTVARLACASKC